MIAAAAVREEWRRGRLRLRGLRGVRRHAALLAVAVILVASAVILATSLGLSLPGLATQVPGGQLAEDAPVTVPSFAILLACLGMAVAAAAIALGSAPMNMVLAPTFIVLELTLAGLGGLVLATSGAVRFHAGLVVNGNDLAPTMYSATGLLALATAALLPVLLFARRRWVHVGAPLLAAAPFIALAATIMLAGDQHADIRPWVQAQFRDYPPRLYLTATIFGPLLVIVGSAAGLVALLTIWQASEFSKATARHIGTAFALASSRWTWLFAALLAAKLAWLAAGLLDLLPPVLGGTSDIWSAIRSDDAFGWGYAAALGLGAAAWLLRGREPIDDDRAKGVAGRVVLLFATVTFLLAALPLISAALSGLFPGTYPPIPDDITIGGCLGTWVPLGPAAASGCLGLAIIGWQGVWWLLVIAAGLVVGIVALRRQPNDAGGIFLVALGAWAMPRAIDAVRRLHPIETPWLGELPALDATQPETFDVVVTLLVFVLALAWWSGRQRKLGPGPLLVILTVSTFLIDGTSVSPSAPGALLLAIAVVFPVLYELGFNSRAMNRASADRDVRVLQLLGVRAFALTVLATLVIVDVNALQESTQVRLGFVLFAIPLGATIVAATVRRLQRRPALGQRQVPQAAQPLLIGGAAGVAVTAVLAGAGWLFQPSLASLYALPASRVEDLRGRFVALDADVQAVSAFDPSAPATLEARWAEETSWTRNHPPPDCASSLWSDWRSLVDDVREVGIIIAAFGDQPANAPNEEVAAVQASIAAVTSSLNADTGAVRQGIEAALIECSGR